MKKYLSQSLVLFVSVVFSNVVTAELQTIDDEDSFLLEQVEKKHILKVLAMEEGNKSAAARLLGVSRKTM